MGLYELEWSTDKIHDTYQVSFQVPIEIVEEASYFIGVLLKDEAVCN
jgi:hypothetical protein